MNRWWSSPDSCRAWNLGSPRGERGAVLPLTLMILLVLTSLVSALLALGVLEPQIAANVLRGTQALSLAEAGAERAIAYFVADSSAVNSACDPACPNPPPVTTLFNAVNLDTLGTYTVTYRSLSFATVLIESTGRTNIGDAQRTVRVVLTRHYVSKFALLGAEVEVEGNAKIEGSAGAIHGNDETEVGGSAFVERTATSSGAECEGCTTLCSPCDPNDPASKGVGIPGASGGGRPPEDIPTLRPADFIGKATIILGGRDAPVPSSCAGNLRNPDGTPVPAPPTTVPERTILNVVAIGSVPACTLTPENSGIFAGWTMHGGGEWRYAGGATPPDGAYYAAREIQIRGSPGTGTTPWKATFIAGAGSEEGEVEIEGHPHIDSFLDDLLIVAGEVDLRGTGGTATLRGAVVATAGKDADDRGEVEIEGAVNLIGNVLTRGEIEVGGNSTVTYNVGTRTRFLGPLRILSWSTVPQ